MEKRIGECIHREQPYVHVLSGQMRGKVCDYCFYRSGKLKKCSSCHVVRYCHRKCQQSDWKIHKVECKCFKNVSPEVPTDSIRMLLRLLIRNENGDHEKTFNDDPQWSRPFKNLMSHSSEIKNDKKRCKQFNYILAILPKLIGQSFRLPSTEVLWETFGKMVINSCCIQDEEQKNILGTGIYLGVSMIDHTCDPNAVIKFSGTDIIVSGTDHGTKAEPSKLHFSYIDTSRPSWDRKEELKQRYYFECLCPLCTTKCEQVDRLMTSVACPDSKCDGFIGLKRDENGNSLWPCDECKTAPSSMEKIEEFHKNWDESCIYRNKLDELFKQGDMKSTLKFSEEKLKILISNNFYQWNINLIKIMDFAKDACIHMEFWEKAAYYADKVSKGLFKIFPVNNISTALELLKLGKLQLYLNRTQAACKSLEKAEKILQVTHGIDHTVYQILVDLQQQCKLLLANPS